MTAGAILADPAYPALKQYVLDLTGLGYYAGRDEDLATRFSRRLHAREASNLGSYLSSLQNEPDEIERLVSELTVGETYFFRQKEHFDVLRDTIIPDIMSRKSPSRSIRIWSAGCATGAEPYSIALLLGLEFREALAGWQVSILGTDINAEFLQQARSGRYRDWYLRDTPMDIISRGFHREGKDWVLKTEFRERVDFRYHNLATLTPPETPAEPFDLIFCRNVIIYFSRETTNAVCASFYENLNTNGWLIVGHAEPNLETFRAFAAIRTPGGTVYRRGDTPLEILHPSSPMPVIPSMPRPPAETPSASLPPVPRVKESPAGIPERSEKRSEPLLADDIRLLADAGKWEAAFSAVEQLIRDEPLNATAHYTMGLFLQHAGAAEEARTAMRRAIYLDRGFALAHYHLGTSLQSAGERDAALKSFRNVLRVLENRGSREPVSQGDGLTAQELINLTKLHLGLLKQ